MEFNKRFKVLGLFVTFIGIAMGFANLIGWFKYPERMEFVRVLIDSKKGIPITDPGSQAFMDRFPPPDGWNTSMITHIVEYRFSVVGGGYPLAGVLRYLNKDGNKSGAVATFQDVQNWANKSPYPWVSWVVTFIGFIFTCIGVMPLKNRTDS